MENYKHTTSMLWEQCQGAHHIKPIQCKAWRVVEDQSRSSTRELVDTLEEHEILEDLIEQKSKPPLPIESEFQGYHYLLTTPFRYPPLQYGSRFGKRNERSLWYGAQELETSFGEAAFYRFLFFAGSSASLLPCHTSHSAYAIDISIQQGISLIDAPFKEHYSLISKKDSYQDSQPLGTAMRLSEVQGFTYFSARIPDKVNIGLFTPTAFGAKSVEQLQHWKCYTDAENVEFTRDNLVRQKVVFAKSAFLVEGNLPSIE